MTTISGKCVECGCETEDRHSDEWMCDECNEQLEAQYQADCRADDPRRGQGDRRYP